MVFLSKTALFFGFWPEVSTKYGHQFECNLSFRKICNFEIFGLEIVKKNAQIEVFGHFSDFASLVFLDFSSCFLTIRWSSQCILVAYPTDICLFKGKNKNTRKRCEMWRCSGVIIFNSELISYYFLLFLLLSRFLTNVVVLIFFFLAENR